MKKGEPACQEVEPVAAREDYEEGLKRGGFLARHPELKAKEKKSA